MDAYMRETEKGEGKGLSLTKPERRKGETPRECWGWGWWRILLLYFGICATYRRLCYFATLPCLHPLVPKSWAQRATESAGDFGKGDRGPGQGSLSPSLPLLGSSTSAESGQMPSHHGDAVVFPCVPLNCSSFGPRDGGCSPVPLNARPCHSSYFWL